MSTIHIIGAGGIGGWLIDILKNTSAKISLYDGDIVEYKNIERQNFSECDIGLFKSDALKKRYHSKNLLEIESFPCFVTSNTMNLSKEDIVIGAIDRAKERLLFSKMASEVGCIYIDVGNSTTDGQVVVEGIDKNITLTKLYPEIIGIANTEKPLEELSCADLAESYPQLKQVNYMGALAVYMVIQAIREAYNYAIEIPLHIVYDRLGSISVVNKIIRKNI